MDYVLWSSYVDAAISNITLQITLEDFTIVGVDEPTITIVTFWWSQGGRRFLMNEVPL